ncbi:MAG: thiamine phosphate synthase, partial [Aquificae bacterium]|nr:thiamine phosphate synthase [Aquificota bacterium]
REVVNAVSIPVYGLGGINENNIQSVFDTGAYGVAAIRLFIN